MTCWSPAAWRRDVDRLNSLPDLQHVEVWLEYLPASSHEIEYLNSLLQDKKVIVHAPFVGISIASHWPDLRELSLRRLTEAALISSAIGATVMTIHVGLRASFDDEKRVLDRVAELYLRLASVATIDIAVENMPARVGGAVETVGSVNVLKDLMIRAPEMSFTLDIGHCIQNGEDWTAFLRDNVSSIRNIHTHDAILRGKGHLTFGDGDLSVPQLTHTLSEVDYDGFVSLETLEWEDTSRSWRVWSVDLSRYLSEVEQSR